MTNANRTNRIQLTDKMLEILTTLRAANHRPVLIGDPGDYSAALGLIRRGLATTVAVKMATTGGMAKAFRITLAGMAVLANRRAEGVAS